MKADQERGPHPDPLIDAIQALRAEVQALRRGQHKLSKGLYDLRHELSHRIANTREELSTLAKISHSDITQRLDGLANDFNKQQRRVNEMERSFAEILEFGE